MLTRKLVVCVLLFAAILAGGWLADRSVRELRSASVGTYRAVEQGIAIVRSSAYPVFRSREYVRIMRWNERERWLPADR